MTRALLFLILIAAGGYWVANHWDEVRVTIGMEEPREIRAVKIAKSDYSLARHRANHAIINDLLADDDEIDEVIGWQTEAKSERIYIVKFLCERDGQTEGWFFEVDIGNTRVRYITADSDLTKKYAITGVRLR